MIANNIERKNTLHEWLFVLLILSFPFGSHIFSFSIGFMTVYPFLVLLGISFLLALKEKFFPQEKLERFYLIVIGLFTTVSFLFLPFVESFSYAIIDIRSVSLFILTVYVFLWYKKIFGYEKWAEKLASLFKIIFVLMATFALFEMLSGIHFSSTFTEHIIERGLEDDFLYHPAFLYDNPNSFLVYLFLVGFAIILLDKKYSANLLNAIAILLFLFFIAFIIKSRIGILLSLLLLVIAMGLMFFEKLKQTRSSLSNLIGPTFIIISFITYVVITKEMFKEIPEENKRIYGRTYLKNLPEDMDVLKADSSTWSKPVTKQKSDSLVPYRNSNSERKALILNGIDFIKDSHYLGVGPGQYRYLHDQGKVKHFAWGNNGPHFWLIEIFSQLGVIPFLAFIILLLWIAITALKNIRKNYKYAIVLIGGILVYLAVSVMPSAFLILDINWIFLTLLVITTAEFSSKKNLVSD